MDAKRITILLGFVVMGSTLPLSAESTRSLINGGNEAYGKEDYVGAEVRYRKALEKEDDLVEGKFNLGGSLYKQGKFDGSTKSLDETLEGTADDAMRARTYFNRGNALFKQQMYGESVESYIESLKLEPNDLDAKHNLLYAMRRLEEQQQEQQAGQQGDQQQQQQSDDNGEKGEDDQGEPGDRERQEERQAGDQQKEETEPDKQSDTRPQPQGEDMTGESALEKEESEISRAEAERILQALEESEKEVQKKLRAIPAGRINVEKDW